MKNAPLRTIEVPFDAAAIERAVKNDGVDVLLACEGLDGDLDALVRVANAHKLMTLGAQRSYIQNALVLGVFAEEDKLRIYVNLAAARQGGFRLSSAMLKLAVIAKS